MYDWNSIVKQLYGHETKETPKWISKSYEDYSELDVLVPGVPKEKLDVYLEGNTLVLEYKDDEENLGPLDTRPFLLKFQATRGYDLDKLDVSLMNGVLKIKVPKLERKKTG